MEEPITLMINPLSTNQCWRHHGNRRYLSELYSRYKRKVAILLHLKKPLPEIPEGELRIDLAFGFSNFNRDTDNAVKPFLDSLCPVLKIDDKRFSGITARKYKVSKGEEFIKFRITPYNQIDWQGV